MERKKSGEEGYEPKVRVEVRNGMPAEPQRRGSVAVDPRSSILDPRSSILDQ
jgi:hypothetical protein